MNNDMIASPDMEAALLGGVLLEPAILPDIRRIIRDPHQVFSVQAYAYIAETMYQLKDAGKPIDLMFIVETLEAKNKLTVVGGAAGVLALQTGAYSSLNMDQYAYALHNMAKRRELKQRLSDMAVMAHNADMSANAVVDAVLKSVGDWADDHYRVTSNIERTGEAIQRVLATILDVHENPRDTVGEDTGFESHNKWLKGYELKELHLVAGRPGMGKTSWCAEAAFKQAQNGTPVLFFSLEMPTDQLVLKMMCQLAKADYELAKTGALDDLSLERMKDAAALMARHEHKLIIIDTAGMTIAEMSGFTRIMKREHGIKVVYVDTINQVALPEQLMALAGNVNASMTHVANGLHKMAKENNVAVIGISQLSRAVEQRQDKRPLLSDLRDSGTLEQNAYTVTMFYRHSYYNEVDDNTFDVVRRGGDVYRIPRHETIEVLIRKNRGGKRGTYYMWWRPDYTGFEPIAITQLEKATTIDLEALAA